MKKKNEKELKKSPNRKKEIKVQIAKGNKSPSRKGKQKSKQKRNIKVQIEYEM